ncbi:family 16 glycosylhydrolase [Haloprofundus halobius]|uniref:family 16 glycosylhydrolase n=1 Tax=Haloprofundus halobius TaxID=2876194 RepID=UPI001CCA5811|nr:family 16 glycosylhydrolase [Haloprofundus halobius]
MAREQLSDDTYSSEDSDDSKLIDRRGYLKLTGASAALLGGLGASTSGVADVSEGGPSNQNEWTLAFEDTFDSGSLDTSNWGVGFGWGMETDASPESISEEYVNVTDGQLRIGASPDNGIEAGAVNTKGLQTFGPGSYWEAKIRFPKRVGFLPAFWAKPDSEDWPPEIDFVELFQTDGSSDDYTQSHHHIHYSSDTEPNGPHEDDGASYDVGNDLCENFHVYGCEWQEDAIRHYVDGQLVAERTADTIVESCNNGAPFYMMLSIHIDRVGTTDKSENWDEEMAVDWVRVWEYGNDGESSSGSSNESSDGDDTEETSEDVDGPFTIAHIPDTQKYVFSGDGVDIARSQTEWIVDNADSESIAFATHVGDVVENGDSQSEYEDLDGVLSVLDGELPYSVCNGNHDWEPYGDRSGESLYPEYFGESRYSDYSWYGGSHEDFSHYQIFEAGGREWLNIALEWEGAPSRGALEWAQSVVDDHSGLPTIVSTHEYLTDIPGQTGRKTWEDEENEDGYSGEEIWEDFVSQNDQIVMVLCGHEYDGDDPDEAGEYHQVSQNDAGNDVLEMLANYQTRDNGGNGWLRLLGLEESADTLTVEATTYSPHLDEYQTDEGSQWSVDLNIDGRFSGGNTGDSSEDSSQDSSGGSSQDSSEDSSQDSSEDSSQDSSEGSSQDSSQDAPSPDEHFIWIRADSDGTGEFEFTVDGAVVKQELSNPASNDYSVSSDYTTARGTADSQNGQLPGFYCDGEITSFDYSGSLEIYLDNEYVEPDELVESGDDGRGDTDGEDGDDEESGSSLPNTLTVDGSGSSGTTNYEFSVSGALEADSGASDEASISDGSASGSVSDGQAVFGFEGELEGLSLDGDATVTLDGQPVQLFRVQRAADSDGLVKYMVESTGRLLKADVPRSSINPDDEVNGGKVFGKVVSGTDAYWLVGGEITDVSTFGGDVVTTLDGTETDFAN